MKRPIVLAGGGTGGHVFVADAIAKALVASGETRDALGFVGSRRGQESVLLADSGISLTLLPGRGIKRSLSPRTVLDNIGAMIGLGAAFMTMVVRFGRNRPRAVVSVGGYAALPAGLAAALWRVPLILVNIDAVPGSTHRLLARVAVASCVIGDDVDLPHSTVTGAPVRDEFVQIDRSPSGRQAAKRTLNCDPERPLISVMTGSLGARSVNLSVLELAGAWSARPLTIYHVCGSRDFTEVSSRAAHIEGELEYRVVAFEECPGVLYQATDVLVSRAGALSIAEIAVSGVAAIMVPLPGAPGDHQTKNAQSLVAHDAGILVSDGDLTAQRLGEEIDRLLNDPTARANIEENARARGRSDAAERVATVVMSYV